MNPKKYLIQWYGTMKDCCVIIPIYNIVPTDDEVISIKRNCSILKDYDIFFIHPFTMDIFAYEEIIIDIFKKDITDRPNGSTKELFVNNIHFKQFKRKYFKSNKSYSRLLLSEEFYRSFLDYEYMLIAQTDTYIVNTEHTLEEFIGISKQKKYDYWGAVWPKGPFCKPYTVKDRFKLVIVKYPEEITVGNGGFSLRHIMNSYNLIIRKKNLIDFYWRFNEDMFFSWFAYDSLTDYNAASFEDAKGFALEENMREEIEKGNIPYAVHAWRKFYPELLQKSR